MEGDKIQDFLNFKFCQERKTERKKGTQLGKGKDNGHSIGENTYFFIDYCGIMMIFNA